LQSLLSLFEVDYSATHVLSTITVDDGSSSTFTARTGHASVVSNNLIYIIGGQGSFTYFNDVWVFDTITRSWSEVSYSGSFTARFVHSATLHDNIIYIIGGWAGNGAFGDVVIFNIATSTFSTVSVSGSFPARWSHTATLVGNSIYVIGGYSDTFLNDVQVFDISTSTWSQITYSGSFTGREGARAVLFQNCIYVLGGNNVLGANSNLNDINKFTIATRTWNQISYSGTFTGRSWFGAVLYNNCIYVISGSSSNYDSHVLNDVQQFNLLTNTWSQVLFNGSYAGRWQISAVLVGSTIYGIGGQTNGNHLNDVIKLDNLFPGTNATIITIIAIITIIIRS
jgi:N-acetylneuraminic acid mutarotase